MSCTEHVTRWNALLAASAAVLLSGCATPARPPRPLPAPVARAMSEELLKPIERPKVEIVGLDENPSPDRTTVTLRGTLLNRGSGPTREVYVHVEALDKDGAVIVSADSDPTAEVLQPGTTGTFEVTFENRPGIDSYHVEAISR